MVESEAGGDKPIARQFGLADAACVDVDFDDAALDAHFAVPVRLAVPDEENVHTCLGCKMLTCGAVGAVLKVS